MLNNTKREEILNVLSNNEYKDVVEGIKFLCSLKKEFDLSWDDIADISHEAFNTDWKEGFFRRHYGEYVNISSDTNELDAKILELKKAKVKLSDERIQNNAYVRKLAREETLKEIALEAAREIGKTKFLNTPTREPFSSTAVPNEAILCISDWHYGIEINNAWNHYNPKVAIERILTLKKKTIEYCRKNNVKTLHIFNLSDLIAGRIHLTIRLQSRIDVITQIMQVSEILAEFINDLSKYFDIEYYSCDDNHSRVEPNKEDSLNLESLCRITDWYLKNRLQANDAVFFNANPFGSDIITAKINGFTVLGVHGDKDKPVSAITSLTGYTAQKCDLIVAAHRHHFSADESCNTLLLCNGSVMGTDSYAHDLRLNSKPSQNLIIVGKNNVMEALYRIVLD